MDIIKERRSIRKFAEKKIEDSMIEDLMRDGMQAPSAANEQPWEFIVIRRRKTMSYIMSFHPYAGALSTADAAIVVCGDRTREKFPGFWVQDCSAAAENILLSAQAHGLGAVWLGLYPMEDRVNDVKDLFHLPEEIVPLCIVALGWPDEERKAVSRYDASRIHQESWQNTDSPKKDH